MSVPPAVAMSAPASSRLHPALAWGLAGTLLASAWALWWPDEAATEAPTAAAATPAAAPRSKAASGTDEPRQQAFSPAATDEPPTLSAAARDPFFPVAAPAAAPIAKAAPEPAPAEPAPPPPPPPAPPPMNHRVIGRFQSPEGQWLVFLQDGAQTAIAAPGVTLSSGYAVESVTAKEIRLRHPLGEQAVSLPLPEDNAP